MNKNYRRDCFAFCIRHNGKYDCSALSEIICKNQTECPFYKNEMQEYQELGEFGTIDNAVENYKIAKAGKIA